MPQSNYRYEVLVIDDSLVYRKIMERVLVTGEYSLSFAADGAEAIVPRRRELWRMPGMWMTQAGDSLGFTLEALLAKLPMAEF